MDLSVLRHVFDDPELERPVPTGARAAVAAIFREGRDGTELLFIERAHREGDPWSGHMALPGGRIDPDDAHPRAAAERETWEEVTLDLRPALLLGQLNDLYGGARPITVSAFGYWLDGPRPRLQPNGEVADTMWITLDRLADPGRAVAYRYPLRDREIFPGIAIDGDRVIWGLTLRLLQDLFERLGRPLAFPV
jgi:8-oxo-dGTP pyrophosphatase MutT (NUDIX family)